MPWLSKRWTKHHEAFAGNLVPCPLGNYRSDHADALYARGLPNSAHRAAVCMLCGEEKRENALAEKWLHEWIPEDFAAAFRMGGTKALIDLAMSVPADSRTGYETRIGVEFETWRLYQGMQTMDAHWTKKTGRKF